MSILTFRVSAQLIALLPPKRPMMTRTNPSSLMAVGREEQSVSDTLSDARACGSLFGLRLVALLVCLVAVCQHGRQRL